MQIDIDSFKKWFGYNRKERRASFILILLIILVWLLRYAVPGKNIEITDLTSEVIAAMEKDPVKAGPLFLFDPNIASFDTLLKAGLDEKEAKTLVNYRSKGGRFRNPSDIKRLYGLDSQKAALLIPYIKIQEDSVQTMYTQRQRIELNSCDSAALERLPGIGPVLSSRIVRYRNLLGGFHSVMQLKEVYGLPPETFNMIMPMVYADTSLVVRTDINMADYRALTRIPYLRRFNLTDILKFRELEGKISSVNELVKNNIIPDSIARKIKPYLVF